MKPAVRVEFTKVGFRDLLAMTTSWQEHHPAHPNAFADDFAAGISLLQQFPESAPLATLRRNKGARLKVLVGTGHLLLYRYNAASNVIVVLAIGAARATPQRP